jgi:hypothetical protein
VGAFFVANALYAEPARATPSGSQRLELEPPFSRPETVQSFSPRPFDAAGGRALTLGGSAPLTLASTRAFTGELGLLPLLALPKADLAAGGSPADDAAKKALTPATAVDLSQIPVDYNDPDPERGVSNHLRAAAGTFAINWMIWQFDWLSSQREIFFVTRETIARNFKTGFVYDDNSFKTNFFGHPFHGSMYMGAARGAGLSFWESLPYPWFGSFMWEFVGERHLPSPNDWVATSWGGTVIGEALFRLANEVFDDSLSGTPRLWSEVGGTALSPMYGLQRVTSGRVTADGAPPKRRRRFDADFTVGIDRVRLNALGREETYDRGLIVALDAEYGDMLPKPGENHIDPFEFFDFYTAFSLLNDEVGGSQLFIEAPMYGWNTYLSDPERAYPDNNVVAITQFFDFQSAGIVQFGGAGLGVGNYTTWRFSEKFRYRISANLQGAFLSGATSPFTAATGRTYNFAAGGTFDVVSRLDSDKFGELGFRARQYLTTVIDGEDGNEFTGYFRPWYKLPYFHGLSLGVAATLINRRGEYDDFGTVRGHSFTTELFAVVEL